MTSYITCDVTNMSVAELCENHEKLCSHNFTNGLHFDLAKAKDSITQINLPYSNMRLSRNPRQIAIRSWWSCRKTIAVICTSIGSKDMLAKTKNGTTLKTLLKQVDCFGYFEVKNVKLSTVAPGPIPRVPLTLTILSPSYKRILCNLPPSLHP